jgi:putative transposase
MPQPHSNALRTGRASLAQHVYLVTTSTNERRPIFADFGLGRHLVSALRWSDAQDRTRTWSYVVMPDHLHWLFELTGQVELQRVIATVKRHSARQINKHLGRRGAIWQPGYHDHCVRREEDLRAIARYVVMNPVRAGLVSSVRAYSLWDARWL